MAPCIKSLTKKSIKPSMGDSGKNVRCATFLFRIQNTGQSSSSNSFIRFVPNHQRQTIIPCVPVSRRYYQHNYTGRSKLNNKSSRVKYALGLVTGIAVSLGFGWYKLKRQVCNCDDRKQDDLEDKITGLERESHSLTIEEAIIRSRDLAKRIKDESGSPGLAVSVSVNGKEVWNEGLGYADVENRVPCSADTVLRIASISKSITMVAVAKQLEAGTLELDKPIQHYIPSFPEKEVNGKKVTITSRQLVSHFAGIRHYHTKASKPNTEEETETKKTIKSDKKTNMKEAAVQTPEKSEYFIADHFKSVMESLNLFKDDPLVHEPGSEYLYTTYGFTLLSAVLEAVTKKPFEKLMQEYFIEMGMENTFLDENTPLIYNRGRHYMKNKNGRLINTPYVDLSYKWAGGGFLSSTRDLVKFGHVMLYSYLHKSDNVTKQQRDTNLKDDSNTRKQKSEVISMPNQTKTKTPAPGFLKTESVQLLWKPVAKTKCAWDKFGYYGMGWAVVPEGENCGHCHHSDHIVSHTGGAIGGSSVLIIKPKDCGHDNTPPGELQGVVVAMIANMTSVSLYKTAVKVAKLFEEASS
ncbi:serine beta-lactamase-like protein LACTB, mitochondrial [Ylistrum balloti]|uniref:serine beta-lactamase-like protein LACTB, mitochondrial n=1 Tax=Ylistrum balloti TaxID=509963 RepID=UPI0029057D6C|nr:serine beta-lactamase-like protein LACTB, mitochondrial [Ylistrum balloti]